MDNKKIISDCINLIETNEFSTLVKDVVESNIGTIKEDMKNGNLNQAAEMLVIVFDVIDEEEPMSYQFHDLKLRLDNLSMS